MAIPTVMGTEIEFGIMVKNDPDFDPISSCVLIVNAYREDPNGNIRRKAGTIRVLGTATSDYGVFDVDVSL